MSNLLEHLVALVWNWPVVLFCLFGGIFFSFAFKLVQFTGFRHAIELLKGKFDNPNEKGEITHFQALSAALSGTIGLGNIAGVAIAIAMGGPGAVFWMWIVGFLGMSTKFIECTLGTKYRVIDNKGIVHGGPMYYLSKALPKKFKPLAYAYAILISIAAIGAGCLFQSNQATLALQSSFNIPTNISGAILLILAAIVIIGGIKRIGKVASKIVPAMCIIYIVGALFICLINIKLIPAAIGTIIFDAFTGSAAAGGFVGVIIIGVRRAIFSNEAGLGSAAIAHSAVKTDHPIREGIVASMGPFIDTIVVCTATALVIILSGNYGTFMYQNTTEFNYTLEEQTKNMNFSKNWSLVKQDLNKEKEKNNLVIPKNKDLLRNYYNKTVLRYTHFTNKHTPFAITINAPEDLIRFSYFAKKGLMNIRVFDFQGELITSVYSDGTIPEPSNEIFINNISQTNKWSKGFIDISEYNRIINEDETLKDKNTSSFTIIFQPIGEAAEWYFDNIEPVKEYSGINLTIFSFDKFFNGFGSIFISIAVVFFAFSTIITWCYYGTTGIYFLMGQKATYLYNILFVSCVYIGAVKTAKDVINFTDITIGLLVIPNIIGLILLYPKVNRWRKEYFKALENNEFQTYK